MRTNPRPSAGSISAFYPAEYGPFRPVSQSATLLARAARTCFPSRMQVLPKMAPGRLLELGCSSGDFLQRKQSEGWNVEGIEASAYAADMAQARGFNVHQAAVESVDLVPPAGGYDVVAAWMVLEHTHQPLHALSRARAWVRPGGSLALSVPDAGSAEFSWFGDAWYALQLPTHLFHFTSRTLKTVLERAGWRVERVLHHRTLANAVASAGYRISDRRTGSRLAASLGRFPDSHRAFYATYPLAWAAAAFGQTGRMTVWARAA